MTAATAASEMEVYIVLGIDENENDQVLAVFYTYSDAKNYCCKTMNSDELWSDYYDLWIEKHPVM